MDFKKKFTKDEWNEILSYCYEKEYQANENILNIGEIYHTLYYLKSGVIEIVIKNIEEEELKLGDISEGALFGELGFLDGNPRSALTRALMEVQVVMLERNKFFELKSKNLELSFKLLWEIACCIGHRMRITNSMMKSKVFNQPNQITKLKEIQNLEVE